MRLYPDVPPEPYRQDFTVVFHALGVVEVLPVERSAPGDEHISSMSTRLSQRRCRPSSSLPSRRCPTIAALSPPNSPWWPLPRGRSRYSWTRRRRPRAGRCGLHAALVRLLDTLLDTALKALCSLALTDGAAVVAADAVRIAMHVLSHPHLPQAWEWAVCLLSILASDGHGVHETTRATRVTRVSRAGRAAAVSAGPSAPCAGRGPRRHVWCLI